VVEVVLGEVVVDVELVGVEAVRVEVVLDGTDDAADEVGASGGGVDSDWSGAAHPPTAKASTSNANEGTRMIQAASFSVSHRLVPTNSRPTKALRSAHCGSSGS
jgi:hypothetical protein